MKKIIPVLSLLLAYGLFGQTNLTVHEWGTFTSFQGGDGNLVSWRPFKTSELPGFVYNWTKPCLDRYSTGMFVGKGEMATLQRMETPVIYFYSSQPLSVDVDVRFPKGLITEWYPQATQIGPAASSNTNADHPVTTFSDSHAAWKNLTVFCPQPVFQDSWQLPTDQSDSHYFAARETKANLVQTSFETKNKALETEKFIFYRGAGSFETPLRVMVDTNNEVTVANRGTERLAHLILVSIHDSKGAFAVLDELSASNSVAWLDLDSLSGVDIEHFPIEQFRSEVGAQMESALTGEGLFPDEARAMVNTWKDSWFTEEGERVLYILPQSWTDGILPLTITPQPRSLVRAMVGRAELFTPQAQRKLIDALTLASQGKADARDGVVRQLRKLGRFAEPAWSLTHVPATSGESGYFGYNLLREAETSVQIQAQPKN